MPLTQTQLAFQSLDYSDHGGSCCGIHHISGFPNLTGGYYDATDECRKKLIMNAVNNCLKDYEDSCDHMRYDEDTDDYDDFDPDKWRTAVECVLIDSQLPEWEGPLTECGFKKVFSFMNSNSGNRCNVFYLETNA